MSVLDFGIEYLQYFKCSAVLEKVSALCKCLTYKKVTELVQQRELLSYAYLAKIHAGLRWADFEQVWN